MRAAALIIAALFLTTGAAQAGVPAPVARECPTPINAETGKPEITRATKECWERVMRSAKLGGKWVWNFSPPAEYDKPYEGLLMFQRQKPEDIKKLCAGQFACAMVISTYNDGKQWAISQTGNRVGCIILLPPDNIIKAARQEPKDVIRHETAHCNGWPPNHPNGHSKWEWVSGQSDGFDPREYYGPPPPRDPFEGIPSTSYPARPGSGPGSGG